MQVPHFILVRRRNPWVLGTTFFSFCDHEDVIKQINFFLNMPCVWIKEALARKGNKFKIDDVSFTCPVAELKEKLSESSGVDKNMQGKYNSIRQGQLFTKDCLDEISYQSYALLIL